MRRRDFLRGASRACVSAAGAGLLPAGLTGCLRSRPRQPALASGLAPQNLPQGLYQDLPQRLDQDLPESACHLPPVRVSADREIRSVVGLRPFRPSGFRVAREQIGTTAVVHNYGHGGGGITLSWGTSKLAADLGLPGHVGPVAVLGSGAVGLATARLAQEAGYAVTIYTKALPPETTSNIAGGQWFPASVYDPDRTLTPEFTAQFVAAARYAYRRYQIMTEARYGIRWMRNYSIANQPWGAPVDGGQFALIKDLLPEIRDLGPREHPFGSTRFVRQFDSLIVEPPMYLPSVLTDVRVAGGRVVVLELRSLEEVQALDERLVFNCTGLGARALFNDAELTPVRGQLTFLLPQPEVTYATLYENTYMFSRRDGVLLGGTHQTGDWNLQPDLATRAAILAKQADLFKGMHIC